jgi:uncharacterized membrane protein
LSPLQKRLSWALALSLGLNLFLLGFGSARWLRHEPREVRDSRELVVAEPRSGRGHGRLAHLLGPPTPELRAQHDTLREARQRVGAALAAEPYDKVALTTALSELRAVTGQSQAMLHARLLERVGTLSLEERRALSNSRFLREHVPGEEPQPGP